MPRIRKDFSDKPELHDKLVKALINFVEILETGRQLNSEELDQILALVYKNKPSAKRKDYIRGYLKRKRLELLQSVRERIASEEVSEAAPPEGHEIDLPPEQMMKKMENVDFSIVARAMRDRFLSGHHDICIQWITGELDTASEQKKEEIVRTLIDCHIFNEAFFRVMVGEPFLRNQMMLIVKSASKSESFYKKQEDLVHAFNGILEIGNALSKDNFDYYVCEITILTLAGMIKGCELHNISLGDLLKPQDVFSIFEKLRQELINSNLLINATHILCSILRDQSVILRPQKESLFSIVTYFLKRLQELINERASIGEENSMDSNIEVIVAICAGCIPFCDKDDNASIEEYYDCIRPTQASSICSQVLTQKATFSSIIDFVILDVVIPRMKKCSFKPGNEIFENFVICLNAIFENEKEYRYEFAESLTSNGYLKYLLEIPGNSKYESKRNKLMLNIVHDLATKTDITLDKANVSFNNTSYLDKVTFEEDDYLLVLGYFHFWKTDEIYMFTFESTISKLAVFTGTSINSTLVLKALWLNLAATAELPCERADYSIAVEKLNAFLTLEENSASCYTHHPALLSHCLRETKMSKTVRAKVIELWLSNSNGDVRKLLEFVDNDVITQDFVIVGILRNPLEIIKAVMTTIEKEPNNDSLIELAWITLHSFAKKQTRGPVLQLLLEKTYEIGRSDKVESKELRNCAKVLCNITCSDNEIDIHVLSLRLMHVLLEEMRSRRDSEVFQSYLSRSELLQKLQIFAFGNFPKNDALKCILSLLLAQKEFPLKVLFQIVLPWRDIFKVLLKVSEDRERAFAAIELLDFCVSNKLENPVASVGLSTENQSKLNDELENLFLAVLEVPRKMGLTENLNKLYHCLDSLLRVSKYHSKLIKRLVTVPFLYTMVTDVIEKQLMTREFLDLVICWLECRKGCIREVPTPDYKTMFEKSIDVINDFTRNFENHVNREGLDQFKKLNDLKTIVLYYVKMFDVFKQLSNQTPSL